MPTTVSAMTSNAFKSGVKLILEECAHTRPLSRQLARSGRTPEELGLTVSLAEGGTGLGTASGEELARRMLGEAGFGMVEVVEAPGPQNSIYICRK
jgi:hypothetical protein